MLNALLKVRHPMNAYTSPSHNTTAEDIHWYMQDIATIPLLSCQQEQEAIQQIAADTASAEADAARTLLLHAHLRLVVRLARRYQPFGEALADLIQEGNLALLKATQQFDPCRNPHFMPFATQRVCWRLYRVVETSLHERHLWNPDTEPLWPLSGRVLKALARNTLDEQAVVFDLPEARFVSLTTLLEEIETDTVPPNERSYAHALFSQELGPEDYALMQERAKEIAACVQTVSMKERLVLTHRYLLDVVQTLEAVGRTLGISRQRVSQLEQRGIRKIRQARNADSLRCLF